MVVMMIIICSTFLPFALNTEDASRMGKLKSAPIFETSCILRFSNSSNICSIQIVI
jgi:hypothetical protein